MSRHSKHNVLFTSHERSLLKYGTQKERLGKDSIKNFDCCVLCLNELRTPMSCTKGHLYCKECIYSNLLDQKKDIKRKEKEWEQQQLKLQSEVEKKQEKEQQTIIEKFEKDTTSATSENKTTTTTTAAAGTMELKSFWIVCYIYIYINYLLNFKILIYS